MTWLLIIGAAVVIGGSAGAWWALRQPDPNPKGQNKPTN